VAFVVMIAGIVSLAAAEQEPAGEPAGAAPG
jgi:hypothetical protein